jgi:hypothetical protein
MEALLAVQRPVAAGGGPSLPAKPYERDGMVGIVKVVRGLGVVVAGAVGVVATGSGVVGTVADGTVAAVDGRAVVGGASSAAGAVVDVAPLPLDDDPPEDELPDEPFELSTDATGAGVLPERSGILSGGVASAGLALVMKRLKICAGREPPLTRRTPWMLRSLLDWPSA